MLGAALAGYSPPINTLGIVAPARRLAWLYQKICYNKIMKQTKCQICKEKEAVYAMQYIGDDKPVFYSIGWHIRGFQVTKVCEDCRISLISKADVLENSLQAG